MHASHLLSDSLNWPGAAHKAPASQRFTGRGLPPPAAPVRVAPMTVPRPAFHLPGDGTPDPPARGSLAALALRVFVIEAGP